MNRATINQRFIGQRGVGLVELMVTLLLGALLTAGIISLFTANRQTFRLQDNVSLAEEAGSFALDFITRDLRRAGYPGEGIGLGGIGGFDTVNTLNDRVETNNELVNGVNTSVTYVDDQLAVVYQKDRFSAETTCTGDAIPVGVNYISNVYYVATNATSGERELMCQGFGLTVTANVVTARNAIGTPQALATGVDSFQVLYGIDTTFDRDATSLTAGCTESPNMPNLYLRGDQLTAAYAYGAVRPAPVDCYKYLYPIALVRSVRIALLVRTSADVDAITPATQTYPVADRVVDSGNFAAIADGRIRRVFTTTVALRNTERVIE